MRYRFNSRFDVVPDTRTMSEQYAHPNGLRGADGRTPRYTPGESPLFARRRSSQARDEFKARRVARRAAARLTPAARAAAAMHEAAQR